MRNNTTKISNIKFSRPILVLLFIIYFIVILISKWVCSDGLSIIYQTLNVLHGDGFSWNSGERTQVSTSPLYSLVSIPLIYFFYSIFSWFEVKNILQNTLISQNIVFSLLGFLIILKYIYHSKISTKYHIYRFILIILSLCIGVFLNKFFIDFSTSGLENSLSYFLLSLLTYLVLSKSENLVLKYILYSLIFLTRFDFILIILPLILNDLFIYKFKILKEFLIMSAIIGIWLLFSTIYFGSFLPNSFYVKTSHFSFNQSFYFFYINLRKSPQIIFILVGLLFTYKNHKPLFIGFLLYIIYINTVKDYMYGRLFTVLIPIALINTIKFIASYNKNEVFVDQNIKVMGFFLFIMVSFKIIFPYHFRSILDKGIFNMSDQKKLYTKHYDLQNMNLSYSPPISNPKYLRINENNGMLHEPLLKENHKVPTYYLDPMGLAQPFIARYIKIYGSYGNKPGHYRADLKLLKSINLHTSILNNKNLITDLKVRDLYDDVNLVMKGNLFEKNRLKAIYRLNTKSYK